MKPTDEIVNKIRKCLALANGLNATQGEMETAMGKAKEIAMRYNIDITNVSMTDPTSQGGMEIEEDRSLKIRSQYQQPYHKWIFHILEEVFEIRILFFKMSTYGGVI